MEQPKIIMVKAPNCRRSRRILAYLEEQDIPFEEVALDSSKGQHLLKKHQFRASPGILVNGRRINPYEVLIQEQCRVDEHKAKALFRPGGQI